MTKSKIRFAQLKRKPWWNSYYNEILSWFCHLSSVLEFDWKHVPWMWMCKMVLYKEVKWYKSIEDNNLSSFLFSRSNLLCNESRDPIPNPYSLIPMHSGKRKSIQYDTCQTWTSHCEQQYRKMGSTTKCSAGMAYAFMQSDLFKKETISHNYRRNYNCKISSHYVVHYYVR